MTPMNDAWELQKKSKPFHGYNPNKHHRKGGLNAKGRAKAKRARFQLRLLLLNRVNLNRVLRSKEAKVIRVNDRS